MSKFILTPEHVCRFSAPDNVVLRMDEQDLNSTYWWHLMALSLVTRSDKWDSMLTSASTVAHPPRVTWHLGPLAVPQSANADVAIWCHLMPSDAIAFWYYLMRSDAVHPGSSPAAQLLLASLGIRPLLHLGTVEQSVDLWEPGLVLHPPWQETERQA